LVKKETIITIRSSMSQYFWNAHLAPQILHEITRATRMVHPTFLYGISCMSRWKQAICRHYLYTAWRSQQNQDRTHEDNLPGTKKKS